MKNFIDDPGYEPVNPYRFDFNIPILRYIQVNKRGFGHCGLLWMHMGLFRTISVTFYSVLSVSSRYFLFE